MVEKANDIFGIDEMKDKKGSLVKALCAELLGTLLLVFFGCGAAVAGSRTIENKRFTAMETQDREAVEVGKRVLTSAFITQVALTFGLVVASIVQVKFQLFWKGSYNNMDETH